MKVEVILRVQETRYSDKVDRYRVVVSKERADYVIKKYETMIDKSFYGSWVLANKLDDNGNFLEILQ